MTGVLSLVLLPFPKTVALIYVAFSGYYVILKARLECLRRPLAWAAKLAVFNVALTVLVILSTWILHVPDGLFEANIFVYLLGNVTFIVYDIALTGLITTYLRVWRKRLRIRF